MTNPKKYFQELELKTNKPFTRFRFGQTMWLARSISLSRLLKCISNLSSLKCSWFKLYCWYESLQYHSKFSSNVDFIVKLFYRLYLQFLYESILIMVYQIDDVFHNEGMKFWWNVTIDLRNVFFHQLKYLLPKVLLVGWKEFTEDSSW